MKGIYDRLEFVVIDLFTTPVLYNQYFFKIIDHIFYLILLLFLKRIKTETKLFHLNP
jgi:hypothetical protein